MSSEIGSRSANEHALSLSAADTTIVVEAFRPGICRLRIGSAAALAELQSHVVEIAAEGSSEITRSAAGGVVRTAELSVQAQGTQIRFAPRGGPELLLDGFRCVDGTVRFALRLSEELRLFGLGEKTGNLDRRGRKWTMINREPLGVRLEADALYQSHPILMGLERGAAFGLYLDCVAHSSFDLGVADASRAQLVAEQPAVDLYLIAGPTPREVTARLALLIGRAALPPRWALGYHQSRWSYMSEREVREIAGEMRRQRIPCDAIHLDIDYMDGWRVFTWNERRFPNPKKLVDDLKEQGLALVVILDPGVKVDPSYDVYREGVAAHYFLKRKDGREYHGNVWPGTTAFPDFSRPEVRSWWAGLVSRLLDLGAAGIWNDMNEPSWWVPRPNLNIFRRRQMRPDDVVFEDGGRQTPFDRLHNFYANYEAMATIDAFAQSAPERRPFVLTRAAFPGMHRFATSWTGDSYSRFKHLAQAVPMLLGMSCSGTPFCGTDIGGFTFSCKPELFARWLQLGVFSPFCRTHSMKGSRRQEPWSFGPEVTAIARRYIELRYRLLPLWVTLFKETSDTGMPPMRPLFFEFPGDGEAVGQDHEFLVGSELLVAPVVEKGAREREVYLPAGSWYDWYHGVVHHGPGRRKVPAPLDCLPLFVRGGAIVPMWPLRQQAAGPLPESLTLLCHPDAERPGRLELYDDEGDGYGYREGRFRTTSYRCERAGTQIVLERTGHVGDLPYAPSSIEVEMVIEQAPREVCFNGTPLSAGAGGWRYDEARRLLHCTLAVSERPWSLAARL